MIHLDTHAIMWLYAGDQAQFTHRSAERLDGATLVVSPMVEFELELLHQKGRANAPGRQVIEHLAGRVGLRVSSASFHEVARHAAALTWTRDPFDRLIAAASLADGAPLLTRDANILKNFPTAVWGK